MGDNINVTPGTGKVVATDEVVDGTLGTVQVQFVKIMDGTLDGTNKLVVTASGAIKTDGSATTQPVSGSVSVSNFPATQPISAVALPLPTGASTAANQTTGNSFLSSIDTKTPALGQATMAASTPVAIASNQSAIPVTGTFFQATQPVSGPLTDTQLRATPVPVSGTVTVTPSGTQNVSIVSTISLPVTGTFFQATQPVSGTFFQATQPVSGTFFQATQPISAASLPLPTGAATEATLSTLNGKIPANLTVTATRLLVDGSGVTQPVSGTITVNAGSGTFNIQANASINNAQVAGTAVSVNDGASDAGTQRVTLSNNSNGRVAVMPSSLSVTATGVAAAAVTLTLPAVAANFHYITGIEIEAYSTAARTGVATPILVTSTNLPGSNVWTFASVGAIGSTDTKWYQLAGAIKSSVLNTATTIVCPATTAVIWRVNVYYYTAA